MGGEDGALSTAVVSSSEISGVSDVSGVSSADRAADATFIGLDLAWGYRNRTGGAVIRCGKLVAATGYLTTDESILSFIAENLVPGRPAVVAVDAPLRVPNETGRRRCDHEVSTAWRRCEAGAYPANRRLLARDGAVRGETLVLHLRERFSFVETAPIPHCGAGRYVCEVFPHPAHVTLFDLARTLKYKRKPGRGEAERLAEFSRYQALLAGLAHAEPPLVGLDPFTQVDAATLPRTAVQRLEEALDAITCAYVGWYGWWHGPGRQIVYGSVGDGHILVPRR